MKQVILSILVVALLAISANVSGKPRDSIVIKEYAGLPKINRNMQPISILAYIDYDTQQVEAEFNMPMPNVTIYLSDEAGNVIATHNANIQMQASLPLPQEQGVYSISIVTESEEFYGEFEIE